MAKVTVTGADSAKVVADIIAKEAIIASRRVALRMAERYAERVRRKIENQEETWHPLSPGYARRKERSHLDPRILIATHNYVDTIQPRLLESGRESGSYEVAPNDDLVPDKGITYRELGVFLEFGTRNSDGSQKMPARPHFRPSWTEFQIELSDQVEKFGNEIQSIMSPKINKGLRDSVRTKKTYDI